MASKYTNREDKYILENFNFLSDISIGKKINRSPMGIKRRRLILGCYRPSDLSGARKHRDRLTKHSELTALKLFLETGIMSDCVKERIKLLQSDLPKNFITRKNHCENSLKNKANAFEMLQSGEMMKDVAAKFSVSRQTIAAWRFQFSEYNGIYPMEITLKSKV